MTTQTGKYSPELTSFIVEHYNLGNSVEDIAEACNLPTRSIIAKLTSMGIYKKKQYLTKRGELPVKKEEYIDRLAAALNANVELLGSLEKVNKNVLKMLVEALEGERG